MNNFYSSDDSNEPYFSLIMIGLFMLAMLAILVVAHDVKKTERIEKETFIKDKHCVILEIDNVDRKIKYKCDDNVIVWLKKN